MDALPPTSPQPAPGHRRLGKAPKGREIAVALALAAAVMGCGTPSSRDDGPSSVPSRAGSDGEVFRDIAAASGLEFRHFNGMSGELYLSEITCAGGAFGDFDGDGDLDVYLLQGAMLGPGKEFDDATEAPSERPPRDRLFLNRLAESGEVAFVDGSAGLGVAATGYGCGVATGDFDGDGRLDLYLANLGSNQLLRNLGGGAFEDVTEAAGADDRRSSVTAAFVDYDRDGWLDLFIGNNVEFDHSGETVCRSLTGAPDYCGPGAYPSQADRLLRNRGDGTFEDVTAAAGLGRQRLPTLGVTVADLDGDDWLDLYVANDGKPNGQWVNDREGGFRDAALAAGSAVNGSGAAEASMGVDAGDFDNDGDEDLFLAHLIKESNTLYRNDGRGRFDDRTSSAGLASPSLPFTAFGSGWLDYDNDGHLDLLVVNGAVTMIPALVASGDPFPLHQRNQLFRNLGDGRFVETTASAGEVFELSEVSRGAAFGDIDNDGDVDVLVVNNSGEVRLLENRLGQDAGWLGLRLVGPSGGDALGARVTLRTASGERRLRRVRSEGSYNAAHDPRVLFGLGGEREVDAVEVRWPDGRVERFAAPPTGVYTTLVQGQGEEISPSGASSPSAAEP
ncbi:MAG: CRTAC1 family protein [Acidobacteriota bacterium]